jgi:hypothetical protein
MNLGKRRRAVKLTLGDGEARTGLGLPMKIGCVLAVEDSDVHPDDLLRRPERDAPERNRAEAYLSLMLSDGEWRSVAKLSKGAEAEGINLRTLQRAADALDIETRTVGFPGDHQWRHVQSRQRADVVTGENASHDTSPVSQQADVTTAEDTP